MIQNEQTFLSGQSKTQWSDRTTLVCHSSNLLIIWISYYS